MRKSGERLTVEDLRYKARASTVIIKRVEDLRYKARASTVIIKRIAAELGVELVSGKPAMQVKRAKKRSQIDRAEVLDRIEGARARRIEEHNRHLEAARRAVAERKRVCMSHRNRETASWRNVDAWKPLA
jgi:hypothetical protein